MYFVVIHTNRPSPSDTTPPASANAAVHALVSDDPRQRNGALTPELARLISNSAHPQPGSNISLDQDGWSQLDHFAAATGTLTVPGKPPEKIVIGFKEVSGRWLVTFEESQS